MKPLSISKVLSANDTGATGAHQAGILVPKDSDILSFFPPLDAAQRNPRCHLRFLGQDGNYWEFAFIYYNNKLVGGTRNEYRLTRMTNYIRSAGLVAGDEVVLTHTADGQYHIHYYRKKQSGSGAHGVLKLGTGWRVVQL